VPRAAALYRVISCPRVTPASIRRKEDQENSRHARRQATSKTFDHAGIDASPKGHYGHGCDIGVSRRPMTARFVRVPGKTLCAPDSAKHMAIFDGPSADRDFAYNAVEHQVNADKGYDGPCVVLSVYCLAGRGHVPIARGPGVPSGAIKYMTELRVWTCGWSRARARASCAVRFSIPTRGLGVLEATQFIADTDAVPRRA